MKIISILLSLILISTSCGESKNEIRTDRSGLNGNNADTSVIAVFPYLPSQHWIFKDGKPADLTSKDIEDIEVLMSKCIEEYNPEQEKEFNERNLKYPEYKLDKKNFVIELKRYKRQYVAVTNNNGEKEVWVNCFCKTRNIDWKKELIQVDDGGNCYFSLKINLTTGKYYDLSVNGDA